MENLQKKSANSTLSEITKSTKKSAKVPKYGKSTEKSAEACNMKKSMNL